MKKNLKTKRTVIFGTTGVLLALLLGIMLNNGEDAVANQVTKKTYAGGMPCAGIALMSNTYSSDENISTDTTGGMASILKLYYENNNEDASVKPVDKVLSLMPQASEEVQDSNNSTSQEDNSTSNIEDNSDTDASTDEAVESVISSYKVLGVANVTNYLNVREEASLDGKILGKLPMNAGCEILETLDGWYKVSSGNVEGYVSAEFLLTGKEANERAKDALATVAKVNADMLMVREEPNTECTILTRVAQDEEIEVVEVLSGWVKVNIDNKTGYVCADYVDVYDTLPKGVTLKELSYGDGVSSTAIELIEYAKQFLGNPYVYGGTSLTNGTDCSGFTMRIYQHFGYSLSRTSRQQAHNGRRVSLSEIQPGDLLFYNHGSQIGHVAIYIGNGQIIHASTERTGIIIGNAYYTTPACATRILN